MKILKNIFSVANDNDRKVIRLLGIKFTFSKFKAQEIKPFNNDKPTIAFHLYHMDKGGLEEVVLQLATNDKIREKYNTVIIAEKNNKGYLANIAKTKGVEVYSFFRNSRNIEKLIQKLNIKIVHFHYDLTGIEEYKNYGAKTMYTIHNNYIWINKKDISWRNNIYLHIDKFIAVSSQVKEYFCEKFGIDKNRVDVISNGIEYFETQNILPYEKEEIGLEKDDFLLLNVATFNLNKYHFAQLKALSLVIQKYKNIKLFLMGNTHDKEYFNKIKEMINDLGLNNNVKILDFVPKSEVFRYLKTSDSVIMTSLTEGFSIAMTETMLLGTPMILTDVGGARDAINNNDIGILVSHAFRNLQDIDIVEIEKKYKNNEFYFENVEEIANAIEDMYLHKDDWKNKAKLGIEKIKTNFNVERVCEEYYKNIEELNFQTTKHDVFNLLKIECFEIAFLAPFPAKSKINEGWMSRISAIDKIFDNKKRLYINPFIGKKGINIYKRSENEYELNISYSNSDFTEVISNILLSVKLMYCHTLHLAEYLIPFLNTNKIIVDIHGVTPEEEVMLGNPQNKEKNEKIEQKVLNDAKYCVMVTNAMKTHYKNKYPDLNPNCIILPIVENLNIDETTLNKVETGNNEIIYSGGIQAWQNLEGMLNLAKYATKAHFTFLSADFYTILKKAKKEKIQNITATTVSKNELKEIYKSARFGLVLRDDSPVNFVACPTKLYEYLVLGIIPVVRTVNIGDFNELGFGYITETDVLNNKFPTKDEMREIIKKNFEVARKMQKIFIKGSEELASKLNNEVSV